MESRRISGVLEGLVNIGASPSDTQQQKAYKSTLTLTSAITAPVVLVWSVLYGSLGLSVAAAIPSMYALATVAGLAVVGRTKRIELFRASQMTMWLTFPFLLQWSVGGFINASAVGLWALGAPLLASLVGAIPGPWFAGFIGLSIISGLIDSSVAARAAAIPPGINIALFVLNFLGLALVVFVSMRYFIRERERSRIALELEQEKSERLLLNILPAEVAHRLKSGEGLIADRVEGVTILFADLVGSTPLSEKLSPVELVEVLNGLFARFDDLAGQFGLEKIKTIGDAYMVVGGLPLPRPDHAEAVANMALAMRDHMMGDSLDGLGPLQMRYGIHTGMVVAGVIGKSRFSYDLWGDTVNTAARMESHGIPDKIQVTEAVYQRLRHRYRLEPRGPIEIKGKGTMDTYLLEGPKVPGQAIGA